MAWTAPMTAVDGNVFTAAQFNVNVRDNLNYLKTEVDGNPRALAAAEGNYFVSTGANSIIQRTPQGTSATGTDVTTTFTSYGTISTHSLAITRTTGTIAFVMWAARLRSSVASGRNYASIRVSGATTIAANDAWAIWTCNSVVNLNNRPSGMHLFNTLTPGSNTFTISYQTSSGTMTVSDSELMVFPLSLGG